MLTLKKRKYHYSGYLYILPWLIGLILFQLYPIFRSLFYSFTNFDLISYKFVGFANYKYMFTQDSDFYASLKVTFLYVLIAVPLKLIFALFIAVLVNVKLKGVNMFRTIYYLPSILGGSVAVSVLWKFIFMEEGVINSFLGKFGIPAISWLGNPSTALYTLSLLTVWQFGSSMVVFLAGLKQVPNELYEAGRLDGASRPRMFLSITMPLLTPVIFFNLIMQMINAFQDFTGAFVITGGGPMKSTYLYALKLYDEAFKFYKIGYASALSWVLFLIIIAFTLLVFKSSNRWVYYEDGEK
jgi:oligogalacturonide transport system permease protein